MARLLRNFLERTFQLRQMKWGRSPSESLNVWQLPKWSNPRLHHPRKNREAREWLKAPWKTCWERSSKKQVQNVKRFLSHLSLPPPQWLYHRKGSVSYHKLLAKQYDIYYSQVKTLQDKWKVDQRMITAIAFFLGSKSMTERIVKRIMQTRKKI